MWIWDLLFGRRDAGRFAESDLQTKFVQEFLSDMSVRGMAPHDASELSAIDSLLEAELLAYIDWADEPDVILAAILGIAGPDLLTKDAIESIVARCDAISGAKGRGAGTYPTITALDEALTGTGCRLIWVDLGGDGYAIGLVSDTFHARWGDVILSKAQGISALVATVENESAKNQRLADAPRDAEQAS